MTANQNLRALALLLGASAIGLAGASQAGDRPAARAPATARVAAIPKVEVVPDNGNLPFSSARYANSRDYGDFARFGYVEKEFYISGAASTRDQETAAILKADLPYVSRIVVRMPADPKAFSGNVLIEPFHAIYEKTDMWMQLHRQITERGDIWIGVTVKAYARDMEPDSAYMLGGVPALKAYDPVRYGRLDLEPDMRAIQPAPPAPTPPQALDLVTQVGALARSDAPGGPLRGYAVKHVYAMGAGISGEVIANYVRSQHDVWKTPDGRAIFDGYFYGITGRFPPRLNNAALVLYRSISEMDRAAASGFIGKTPDAPNQRVYNVVGMSHINSRNISDNEAGLAQLNSVLPNSSVEMPKMPYVMDAKASCPNMNDDPSDLFLGAMLVAMEEWGEHGTPLPAAPLPQMLPGDPDAPPGDPTGAIVPGGKRAFVLKTDAVTGTVLGGVRLPWVEAPIASYGVRDPKAAGPGPGRPGAPSGPPPGAPPGAAPGGPPVAAFGGPPGAGPGGPPGAAPRTGPPMQVEPVDGWPLASKARTQLPTKPGGAMSACFLYNPRIPLDAGKLRALYSSYDDYVAKFEVAKKLAVRNRWLLPADAAQLRPRGTPADFRPADR